MNEKGGGCACMCVLECHVVKTMYNDVVVVNICDCG